MNYVVLVKLIQAQEVDRSVYSLLIKEIRYHMTLRESYITHVNRTQNKINDSLTKFACLEGGTMTWTGSGPLVVVELATIDCMNIIS